LILILSASYITKDLVSDFGKIPVGMLPLQNRCLYEHQIKSLSSYKEDIYMSLPNDYTLSKIDLEKFSNFNVSIIFVPATYSYGELICHVLNEINRYDQPVRILDGETFFSKIPMEYDTFLISNSQYIGSNHFLSLNSSGNSYYVGFYSFSDQNRLISAIEKKQYNFLEGIKEYQCYLNTTEISTQDFLVFRGRDNYFQSKSTFTTQRSFNDLKIDSISVTKSSLDSIKISAEANWYIHVPFSFKKYLPKFWQHGQNESKYFYQIEYLNLSTLSELFVFGNNEFFIWENILKACNTYFLECLKYNSKDELDKEKQSNPWQEKEWYRNKTSKRLSKYAKDVNLDCHKGWVINNVAIPSLNEILLEINLEIENSPQIDSYIFHGDFCFSNIFYDFKLNDIKIIDPRGVGVNQDYILYGDIRYDVAKLAHSILGLYDYILADCYEFKELGFHELFFQIETKPFVKLLQDYFLSMDFANIKMPNSQLYARMIHLFLSMLPLHRDSEKRQKALLANALRLYVEFKKIKK